MFFRPYRASETVMRETHGSRRGLPSGAAPQLLIRQLTELFARRTAIDDSSGKRPAVGERFGAIRDE
jgi:hypothetical protein